jgi:sarcosine oxidase subunit beta
MSHATSLPTRTSVLIIGGGIQGLSIAYNLAARGERHVVVLDAGYFQGGSSGRNGTMIRGGFMSEAWTSLFALANRRWIELSRRLRRNVMFSRRGYLLIAEEERTAGRFEGAIDVHRRLGVRSRRVNLQELANLAPAIRQDTVRDAIYLPDGGVAPHQAAMMAYLEAARELGVQVRYQTPVTGISRRGGEVTCVSGEGFEIDCEQIVIAAGAATNTVAGLLGADVPAHPLRIEAMALEPVRPILRPGVAFIDRLCYVSQTARGEIVGGTEVPESPHHTLASDLPSIAANARVYCDMLPCLANLRILRQWAGFLHVTPDFGPLIGLLPSFSNVWVSAGWCYGYAAAPAVGELLSEAIAGDGVDGRLAPFALDRFARNQPVVEGGIVVASPEANADSARAG